MTLRMKYVASVDADPDIVGAVRTAPDVVN